MQPLCMYAAAAVATHSAFFSPIRQGATQHQHNHALTLNNKKLNKGVSNIVERGGQFVVTPPIHA